MNKNGFKIRIIIFTMFLYTTATAQNFTAVLDTLNTNYRQEKLYLQFDRAVYTAGETIWFKAYLFAGNFPSLISKTLYTEVTDANGKLLQRITSPVIMSSAAGSLDIPSNISGNVFVKCYTKWMLNFDSSFIFSKAIFIIPVQKKGTKPSLVAAEKTSVAANTNSSTTVVQFFPEGGDLVQDVESRVAFKATNNFGIPVNINGDILDSKGKTITSFTTMHDGMGTFTLQPLANEQYKAVWKDVTGQTHENVLPQAKPNGIVLEANYTGHQIEFTIKRSATTNYAFVYVMAQMQQQQLYRAKSNISQKLSFTSVIPTDNFPAGIIQLTIFSPDEKPLAERIVFINLADFSFNPSVNASEKNLGRRQKNVIQIDIPDTVSTNLSIAITDAGLNYKQSTDNIFSTVLLTSDIKGYVYNPAYYFSTYADSIADHLDLVMLTNGWRRFKWIEVLAGHYRPLNYFPENYISIEGQLKDINKSTVAGKEVNGILETRNKKRDYLISTVQKDGSFSFSGMIFYDTAKLFYQFNNDKNKNLTSRSGFEMKSNLFKGPLQLQQPTTNFLPSLIETDTASLTKLKTVYQQHLDELEFLKSKTLKTVVVTSKEKTKRQLIDEEYTTGFFSDDPSTQSKTILPEDDPAFLASQNLFAYLQGRIAGLQITLDGNDALITWRSFETSLFVNEVPQTSMSFATGKIMEDPSYILSLSMSEIAMVKIFEPPFFGSGSSSSGGQGGAISVYLKKGRTGYEMSKGLDFTTLAGYTAFKEFYSPDYSMPDNTNTPDYRTTLYWNPFIVTDKNNRRILLPFYNNDFTKKMKIIIEGCNENGKLTRIEKIIE